MLVLGLLLAMSMLTAPVEPSAGDPEPYALEEILDALRATESGGHGDDGRGATGDGGRAIGPYQIHRTYFVDSGVAGRYQDCRDPEYARRVVIAYWQRWCPDALERRDAEVLARVHNGGPRGARKSSTRAYWRRVESRLLRCRLEPGVLVVGAPREDPDKHWSELSTGVESATRPATSRP